MAERSLTIKIVGDSREMRRAARDVVSSLDETESAGKRLASEIDRMSDQMQQKFRDAADTTRVLEEALGSDTVAALQSVGRNVEDMVREWQQAGVSFDEIRADADVLADSLRRSVQAGVDLGTIAGPADQAEAKVRALGDAADVSRSRLDGVRDSGDQSRSVLANLVGNSTQDLGELGGVAGTAGVALGQLAEYAVDGNIRLAQLVKFAGPMVAVGAAVAGVSWAIGKLGEESERAKEAAEGMLKVHEELRDGNFENAATALQEEWRGTISALTDMGFTTEQVIGHMTGLGDISTDLEAKVRATSKAFGDDFVAREEYQAGIDDLRKNLDLATTAFADQGNQLDETTTQTNAIESALRTLNSTADDTVISFGDVDRSAQDFTAELRLAEAATRDMDNAYSDLLGNLDQEEKWAQFNEAVWTFADGAGDAEAEMRAWKRAAADVILSLEDMPEEQRTKLLMEVDEGDKATVDAVLFEWQQGIDVPVRFKGQGSVGFEKKAEGGFTRGGLTLVGEEGPEFVQMPAGAYVYTAPETARMLTLDRVSAATGGGVTNIYLQGYVTRDMVDELAVGLYRREQERR